MRCIRVVCFMFLSFALAACATPPIPDPDYAGMFADRFAAEFDGSRSTRETWLKYGGRAVREIQEKVYPPVSYEDFSDRAVARIRVALAIDPGASPERLSFVALEAFRDPEWLIRRDRNIIFRIVSEEGRATAQEKATQDHLIYQEAGETGFGVAALKVPVLDESLTRHRLEPALLDALNAHEGPILLDLRGNSGGFLRAVPRLASFFLPSWTLVFTNVTREQTFPYRTKQPPQGRNPETPLGPVLVLVDEDTNGGAIAVAAALQDHGAGRIAGRAPQAIKHAIEDRRMPSYCPPGTGRCSFTFPTGLMVRPSGRELDEDFAVDYPLDPQDHAALAEAVKNWLGEEAETASSH